MAAVPHVVVITFPFASHAVKLFRLARALAAAAPAATFSFLSTAGSIAQLQEKNQDALEANLRFVEVPDGLLPPSSDSDGPAPPPNHMVRLGLFIAAAEAGGVKVALETARASAGGARVTCVVGDAFVWMAADAAAAVGAPWVPVWTGGPSALLAHLQGDTLRHDIGDKAARRADELLTSHPGLGSYRVRDLPDGCVFGEMHLPIVALFRRVAEQLLVPRAATAVALKEYWPLLPPGFLDLDRAKVVPWAPQAAVLRHASVGSFVTHAGWASVLEGVAGGVPMACRPFFSDQRMNARMVTHVWGFGTVFEQPMTRGTVAAAVSSLLAGDQGTRMQEMRDMAASAFAADGGSRKNFDKLLKIVCCSPQEQTRDDHVHVDEAAEVTRCAPAHDLLGASSLAHTVVD